MIEVVAVTHRPVAGGALKSAAVDAPAAGATLPGYGIEIAGWATAAHGAAVECIEILHGEAVLRTAPLTEVRPDVRNLYGLLAKDPVGFRTRLGLFGLPLRPTLRVAARVGGERLEVAEIVLQRQPLHLSPPPAVHPLIVTTPGRTGSVWFSRLVGQHPAIVSYRPFELEPRVGSYWADVLRGLADPVSVYEALAPRDMSENWLLGRKDAGTMLEVHGLDVEPWLVEDHPERVARFCLESASAFYARVAELQEKPGVVYYAEKYSPSWVPSLLIELDAGAKEVFLVRDPRDQLASVVSWTASGRAQFSEDATTADEYIDWLSPQTKLLMRHWQARSARSLLVRYEDLVLEPAATLTRLFDYLEVDSSPETVSGVIESARRLEQRRQRGHQTSKSPQQSVGRWRRDVSPDLWERIHDVFAPELEVWYGDAEEVSSG